jgi:hypothetical protein
MSTEQILEALGREIQKASSAAITIQPEEIGFIIDEIDVHKAPMGDSSYRMGWYGDTEDVDVSQVAVDKNKIYGKNELLAYVSRLVKRDVKTIDSNPNADDNLVFYGDVIQITQAEDGKTGKYISQATINRSRPSVLFGVSYIIKLRVVVKGEFSPTFRQHLGL